MSAVRWLIKCGAAAAIVLIACGFATARFGSGLQMPATTTRDGTLITLSRYLREPVPDIVLVGSSITFRLKEEYFATRGLRNLALAGGSPVTGLEIVANQPRLPQSFWSRRMFSPVPPIPRWSNVTRAATLSRFSFAPCGPR